MHLNCIALWDLWIIGDFVWSVGRATCRWVRLSEWRQLIKITEGNQDYGSCRHNNNSSSSSNSNWSGLVICFCPRLIQRLLSDASWRFLTPLDASSRELNVASVALPPLSTLPAPVSTWPRSTMRNNSGLVALFHCCCCCCCCYCCMCVCVWVYERVCTFRQQTGGDR